MAVACQKEDGLQSESPVLMESLEIVITDEMQDAMTDENGVLSYPLHIGKHIELEYAVTPSEDELTYPGVVWTSSNAGVASVDENGRVTAISTGYTVITLSPSNDENNVPISTLRIEVPAPPVPVEGITVSVEGNGPGACYVDGTIQLAAAVVPDNADDKTLNWTTITATAVGSDSENPVKGEIAVYVENNVELSFTNVENSALTLPIGGSFAFETEISDGVTGTSYAAPATAGGSICMTAVTALQSICGILPSRISRIRRRAWTEGSRKESWLPLTPSSSSMPTCLL